MIPWMSEPNWLDRYAKTVVELKNTVDAQERAKNAVERAFNHVYRAVAFDVDGTLTMPGVVDVDEQMAKAVGSLLKRGVPVILITGRNIRASREAAQAIQTLSGLSSWYMRRLCCITQNGVYLLQTPSDDPTKFLSQEDIITPLKETLEHLRDMLRGRLDEHSSNTNAALKYETYSVRIEFQNAEHRSSFMPHVDEVIEALSDNIALYRCIGSYGTLSCLDVSGTNKLVALNHVGRMLGIEPNHILRIGDQGQEDGNDFDLLNSTAGFSVGELSADPEHCLPVLDASLRTAVSGPEATERLMRLILLFPPLSMALNKPDASLAALRKFEILAGNRSRTEFELVVQRVRLRLRYMLNGLNISSDLSTLALSDIFDPHSGGIRLRDGELDELPTDHPVLQLFDAPHVDFHLPKEPKSRYAMFTDTGILLRGPFYYHSRRTTSKKQNLAPYIKEAQQFIERSIKGIQQLSGETPTLVSFKLALAVLDNVRNILLQLMYICFAVERGQPTTDYSVTRSFYQSALKPHVEHHYNFLLNLDADWKQTLSSYTGLLGDLCRTVANLNLSLKHVNPDFQRGELQLFKWRECDDFLQNITAVQLGLQEICQSPDVRDGERLVAVGIAYGGLELPCLASVIASTRSLKIEAAILRTSHYSDEAARNQVRQEVRAGGVEYVQGIQQDNNGICMLDDEANALSHARFIIMDDNCTTCITLQRTRDLLVTLGADVVGSVIVRFPSVSRHLQMALPQHGFPDPDILFSFVRGLIAPSPYARLIVPSAKQNNPYRDQTGVFDKAKARIDRYLKKNGTPVHT